MAPWVITDLKPDVKLPAHATIFLRLLKKWEDQPGVDGRTLWLDREERLIEGRVVADITCRLFKLLKEGEIYSIRDLIVLQGLPKDVPRKELFLRNVKFITREPDYFHKLFPQNGHESIQFDQFTPRSLRRSEERIDYTGLVVKVKTINVNGEEAFIAVLLEDLDGNSVAVNVHDVDRMPCQLTTGYLIGAELQGPVVITVTCLCMLDEEDPKWKEVWTTNGTRVIHHCIISELCGYLQRNALVHRPIGVYSDFLNNQLRCFRAPLPTSVTIHDFLTGFVLPTGARIKEIPPHRTLFGGEWTPIHIPPNVKHRLKFQVPVQCSDELGDMRLCFSDGAMTALLGFTADEFCKFGPDHQQHLLAEMVDKLHIIKVRLSPYYHIGCQYEVVTLLQYQ